MFDAHPAIGIRSRSLPYRRDLQTLIADAGRILTGPRIAAPIKWARLVVHGQAPSGEARGGLSDPEKMPGRGWSLPAGERYCPVGARLRRKGGTVCADCYACKGRYAETGVAASLQARADRLEACMRSAAGRAHWVAAMAILIRQQSPEAFRWHDSGDLWDDVYLLMILAVIRLTPETRHWIPTKEVSRLHRVFVRAGVPMPRNVTIRYSAPLVGTGPVLSPALRARGVRTSTVAWSEAPANCPAPQQDGYCADCRRCWDRSEPNANYHLH